MQICFVMDILVTVEVDGSHLCVRAVIRVEDCCWIGLRILNLAVVDCDDNEERRMKKMVKMVGAVFGPSMMMSLLSMQSLMNMLTAMTMQDETCVLLKV